MMKDGQNTQPSHLGSTSNIRTGEHEEKYHCKQQGIAAGISHIEVIDWNASILQQDVECITVYQSNDERCPDEAFKPVAIYPMMIINADEAQVVLEQYIDQEAHLTDKRRKEVTGREAWRRN